MILDATSATFLVGGALLLNGMLGVFLQGLGMRFQPAGFLRRSASWFERRLNRPERTERDRALRGAVVLAILVAAGGGAGLVLSMLPSTRAGYMLQLLLLALLLEQQDVFSAVRRAGKAVELTAPGLAAAREAAALALERPMADLDQHGIARAAIEEAALRFARGVVLPVFWFLLLGFPGFLGSLSADAALRAFGDRPAFGRAARAAETVLAFVPARIAAALLAFAALGVPQARAEATVPAMMRSYPGLGSINSGWPLGAVAGALGLALAGPARRAPWVGGGRARATSGDVRRMLLLYVIACALHAAALLGAGAALRLFA